MSPYELSGPVSRALNVGSGFASACEDRIALGVSAGATRGRRALAAYLVMSRVGPWRTDVGWQGDCQIWRVADQGQYVVVQPGAEVFGVTLAAGATRIAAELADEVADVMVGVVGVVGFDREPDTGLVFRRSRHTHRGSNPLSDTSRTRATFVSHAEAAVANS